MSRKLKFRAWLKGHWAEEEGSSMLYDYQNNILSESEGWDCDNFPIMQYTDQKDMHGKEIYEGDIVKDHDGYKLSEEAREPDGTVIHLVKWNQDYGSYCLFGKRTVDYMLGGTGKPINQLNPLWCNCLEIIGNLYENPELLEAQNEKNN